MKILAYSIDIMLGEKIGEKFFATFRCLVRKNPFSDSYYIDNEKLEDAIYKRYPSLHNKKWHIEENKNDTYEKVMDLSMVKEAII